MFSREKIEKRVGKRDCEKDIVNTKPKNKLVLSHK